MQNELIVLLAKRDRQGISEKVTLFSLHYKTHHCIFLCSQLKGCLFSPMGDEAHDVSGSEQLSVILRVIDCEVQVKNGSKKQSFLFKEYFLGYIKLDQFGAEILTNEVVVFIICKH